MTVTDPRSFISEDDAYAHFITEKFEPMFRVLVDVGNMPIQWAVTHTMSEALAGNPTTTEAAHNLINASSFASAREAVIISLGARL